MQNCKKLFNIRWVGLIKVTLNLLAIALLLLAIIADFIATVATKNKLLQVLLYDTPKVAYTTIKSVINYMIHDLCPPKRVQLHE